MLSTWKFCSLLISRRCGIQQLRFINWFASADRFTELLEACRKHPSLIMFNIVANGLTSIRFTSSAFLAQWSPYIDLEERFRYEETTPRALATYLMQNPFLRATRARTETKAREIILSFDVNQRSFRYAQLSNNTRRYVTNLNVFTFVFINLTDFYL